MHLKKRGFVIFLQQWPAFSDFFDTRLLNYIPSGIRICFPLFWGIFLGLGPNIPIEQCICFTNYVLIIFRDIKEEPDSNISPPRKIKEEANSDISPPRRGTNENEDLSRATNENEDLSPPRKQQKTLDGKKAGLQDAKSVKKEMDQIKIREGKMFEKVSNGSYRFNQNKPSGA